jgi:hypothetical protein
VSDARWKRHEREIAAALGGIRLPNNGRGQPDIIAGNLAVQVKTRTALPSWLIAAMEQATRDAPAGMVPVVVLSEATQGRKSRRYLVMELAGVVS